MYRQLNRKLKITRRFLYSFFPKLLTSFFFFFSNVQCFACTLNTCEICPQNPLTSFKKIPFICSIYVRVFFFFLCLCLFTSLKNVIKIITLLIFVFLVNIKGIFRQYYPMYNYTVLFYPKHRQRRSSQMCRLCFVIKLQQENLKRQKSV